VRRPTIGVVVPSYNHESFLEVAITSALDQTLPPDRVVVVDDGSCDGSVRILERLREDRRVTALFQENRGAHATLTRGVDEIGTDLVFILNSDDRYAPDRIERFAALFAGRPHLGLAGSWLEIIDKQGRPMGVKEGWDNCEPWKLPPRHLTFQGTQDPVSNLLQTNYLATTSNFVFASALWRECRPFRPLRYAHDWDFALRASAHAELAVIPRPLVQYRVHGANTIREDRQTMELEILWVQAANLSAQLSESEGADFYDRLLHSFPDLGHPRTLVLLVALAAADARNGGKRLEEILDVDNPLRRRLLEEMANAHA